MTEKTRFGHPMLEGWTDIAHELGKAVSTAKVYSRRTTDPLPVQRDELGNRVWAYVADLQAWARRQGWSTAPGNSGQ